MDLTHRVSDFISGFKAYIEGTYAWKDRKYTESISGDSETESFGTNFSKNYNISIDGQIDGFIGGRLGANEDQTEYLADLFFIASLKADSDIGHIESDNVDYSNINWGIGPGFGTSIHAINGESIALDINAKAQYYLVNFTDTAYKAHEIHAIVGTELFSKSENSKTQGELYADYSLNISKDNELFHQIDLGGKVGYGPISLYAEGTLFTTESTDITGGEIKPTMDIDLGIQFEF